MAPALAFPPAADWGRYGNLRFPSSHPNPPPSRGRGNFPILAFRPFGGDLCSSSWRWPADRGRLRLLGVALVGHHRAAEQSAKPREHMSEQQLAEGGLREIDLHVVLDQTDAYSRLAVVGHAKAHPVT